MVRILSLETLLVNLLQRRVKLDSVPRLWKKDKWLEISIFSQICGWGSITLKHQNRQTKKIKMILMNKIPCASLFLQMSHFAKTQHLVHRTFLLLRSVPKTVLAHSSKSMHLIIIFEPFVRQWVCLTSCSFKKAMSLEFQKAGVFGDWTCWPTPVAAPEWFHCPLGLLCFLLLGKLIWETDFSFASKLIGFLFITSRNQASSVSSCN